MKRIAIIICLLSVLPGCIKVPPHIEAAAAGAAALNRNFALRNQLGIGLLRPDATAGVQFGPSQYRCRSISYDDAQVYYTVTLVGGVDRAHTGYEVSDIKVEFPTIKF